MGQVSCLQLIRTGLYACATTPGPNYTFDLTVLNSTSALKHIHWKIDTESGDGDQCLYIVGSKSMMVERINKDILWNEALDKIK